ncbi:MAG: hypothetical protein CMH69_19300 [Nitratireductor sp.]|jgi:hypothetical protein|uniref:hypothetical protein n=1 Tax=Nitratireductor sp. L15S-10 TaxID=3034028 RepID=UPI000C91659F|nr:hypothetical protein [Nitratireductor sp.]
MVRAVVAILLALALSVHAATWAVAATSGVGMVSDFEITTDFQAAQTTAQSVCSLSDPAEGGSTEDDGVQPSQHVSPYQDHCGWLAPTMQMRLCGAMNEAPHPALARLVSLPILVSVPPPQENNASERRASRRL